MAAKAENEWQQGRELTPLSGSTPHTHTHLVHGCAGSTDPLLPPAPPLCLPIRPPAPTYISSSIWDLPTPSSLLHRAYCTHADALWPPLWLAMSACALELTGLPLLLLVPLLLAAFLGGVYFFAVVLAGVWTS